MTSRKDVKNCNHSYQEDIRKTATRAVFYFCNKTIYCTIKIVLIFVNDKRRSMEFDKILENGSLWAVKHEGEA